MSEGRRIDIITQQLLSQLKGRIPLSLAKELLNRVEAYAAESGKACVLALCDAHGNPIAVHVMEDAYLVSYEAATQKAYTAVAVKCDTMSLSKLVQPGETFYGLEALDRGKIVAFGGGVPLRIGDTIVAGLGISGGTGAEDHEIALYGQQVFEHMITSMECE